LVFGSKESHLLALHKYNTKQNSSFTTYKLNEKSAVKSEKIRPEFSENDFDPAIQKN